MSLSQYERERFLYGDAAGDNKGDYLRVHAIKAENALSILFSWLSGAASEVSLLNNLPISRGGTGASTAQKARLNLGLFVTTNNEIVFGGKGISLYDSAVLDHDGTVKPSLTKHGVGDYTVGNVTGFASNTFTYILPRDELGNLLCGCEITFTGECNVKVYDLKHVDGKVLLDKTKPMDIPSGRCIDISAK